MEALCAHRRRRSLSQRELARRAGVAYKTVQLLEAGGHDARSSTLARLAKALGLSGPEALLAGRAAREERSAAGTVALIARDGEESSWKLRLFDFVDEFRRSPDAAAVARAPGPGGAPRMLALTAAVVEALCVEKKIPVPWWCAGAPPLEKPWFVAGAESLKAAALVESPAAFRSRNVFVLANFLSRA
ncbi:MAG: helix-turn-helix transcriptional regulator [Elusimicrobia bacterium]|nr:helix-turn-helix transcriptional regulator [Elusimicrobiota bacterium]